jgi:predicted PurR-regulated permease PerM
MYPKFPKKVLFSLGIGLIIWIIAGYLLPLWLPFLIGIGLATAAEPTAQLLRKRARLPQAMASAVSVSAVWLLGIAVISLLLGYTYKKSQENS